MSTRTKWLRIGSLIFAGLLCLALSLFGGFGLLWSGFPGVHGTLGILLLFIPFVLMFPLFVLSLGITRLAPIAMWLLILVHWSALVYTALPSFTGGPLKFAELLALTLFEGTTCSLMVAAASVLYGVRLFQEWSFDEFLFRKLGARNETSS